MPSSTAKRRAFSRSLEASAVTSHHSPCCIAGITFLRAMLAVPKTPHWTFFVIAIAHPKVGQYSFGRLAYEQKRSEEHTSELQSRGHLVCRLLLEKKNTYH